MCPAKMCGKKMRTPGGSIKASAREKHAVLPNSRFPVGNKDTAESAIKLRGHAGAPGSPARKKVLKAAAKFLPGAAKEAMARDAEQE